MVFDPDIGEFLQIKHCSQIIVGGNHIVRHNAAEAVMDFGDLLRGLQMEDIEACARPQHPMGLTDRPLLIREMGKGREGKGHVKGIIGKRQHDGVGIDNIDVEYAKSKDIEVKNTPEASSIAVAELAVALMLALINHIPEADKTMKEGKWEKKKLEGRELFNKTLGLMGAGHIGQIVASRAKGMQMKVIVYDPYIKPETVEKLDLEPVNLDEL